MTVADIAHLMDRAQAHLEAEDFEAGRADYEFILAQDNGIPEAMIGLGDCCFGLGEYDASGDAYRDALKTPVEFGCLVWVGAVLRVTGYYEKRSICTNGPDAEPERTEA